MLKPAQKIPFDDKHWRRINMRAVSHLLGAEMLHNLYNRHWPRINSLRFRHTVTTYKNGIVESYAPIEEWQYLQNWLSKKFIALDPVLLREIESIMSPDYGFINELINKISSTELSKISNDELALLLIDIMDFPLGDIYKLNVVQIEYSLNYALHSILSEYESNPEDRNLLLSELISPGELTVSQVEEIAFGRVVSLALTTDGGLSHPDVVKAVVEHHGKFSATHCAYGEAQPSVDDYRNKLQTAIKLNAQPMTSLEAEAAVKGQYEKSKHLLEKLNDTRLTVLCDLMSRIGVFRDKNKAKLGETVVKRFEIIEEISRRADVPTNDINYYLMSELTQLIESGEELNQGMVAKRRLEGVSFTRSEDVVRPVAISVDIVQDKTTLSGICASPGAIRGTVKIIYTKDDIDKITPADIMVAVGTDFDLLEIMNVCSGIVTEEGGLLSHASVVSRELKKPCLIGVANATKILKDGDVVCVDATRGIIVQQ